MDISKELAELLDFSNEMHMHVNADSVAFNEASSNFWAKRREIILEVHRLQGVEQKSFWMPQQITQENKDGL